MNPGFTHLHVHSHYSLLTALPKIEELVKEAKKRKMKALALTDNGNLYGVIKFYKTCRNEDIKPIIGMDAYLEDGSVSEYERKTKKEPNRLILLAKTNEGYKNLMRLSTDAFLKGFYEKPLINYELLRKYNEGIIAILPAFTSEIASNLNKENSEGAEELIHEYKNMFGENNVFLQVTRHPENPEHEDLIQKIIAVAKKTKTKLVAGHEIYYLKPEDVKARETLLSIKAGGPTGAKGTKAIDLSFISPQEMKKRFKDIPEALDNAASIAETCNVEIEIGEAHFPSFKLPPGATAEKELEKLVESGLLERGVEKTEKVKDQIDYELGIINTKGYAPYFLVVADMLRFARTKDIPSNIRGSVTGSMVTYLTGITNLNPFEYGLRFERFLNPERPSLPDIDMDFADNRRDEVIDYAREKYGKDKVAQIGTFGTMMARGAVRDVARALGYPYVLGDRIAKIIPFGSQGFPMTIKHALTIEPELKTLYEEEPEVQEIIDMAQKIEGNARHISVHAAGVVIAPTEITDFTPIQLDPKGGKLITQYDMHAVEDAGLPKFDFLGLKNLSILADAIKRIKWQHDIKINLQKIPVDDKKTFELLSRGETHGVFQLNGAGITKFLMELRPTSIHDINAMVALYRPGPMEFIPEYIRRKHNPNLVDYPHPLLKEDLEKSYGLLIYQEDVMMTAIKLAGYSWLEADMFRKAMGKKIPKLMEEQEEKFKSGCVEKGIEKELAEDLWERIKPFAAYAFNKCVVGSTLVSDPITGERISVKDLYESNKCMHISTLSENGKIETSQVKGVFENGIKDVYELVTRTGRVIQTTSNHPFYTFKGWCNLEDLEVGSPIAVPRLLPEPARPIKMKGYQIATLGYLLAEGNFCHPHGNYFYSKSPEELDDFESFALQFPNTKTTRNDRVHAVAMYLGQINQKKGNGLDKWVRNLGLKDKKATEKYVPHICFQLSNKNLALLLGKMWQGDGTVSIKNVQIFYATSSQELAQDVQHILLRLGILSTIHIKKFKYRGGIKDGYTIVVSHRDNIVRFTDLIGKHLVGEKRQKLYLLAQSCRNFQEKLGQTPARGTREIIPVQVLDIIREEMSALSYTPTYVSENTGVSSRLLHYGQKKKGYQRDTIVKIAKFLKSRTLSDIALSDIHWDEIKSIRHIGKEKTYDLTVPTQHNFIANNIFVHNSHSASYGQVAYQTAYFKANYPIEYMASLLTADSGDVDKIGEIVSECERMQIPILAPDINESFGTFTIVENAIRFGLYTIKNFGEGIGDAIIEERDKNGHFKSLEDLLQRVRNRNLNRKSLEALIKSGALDKLGERGKMLANIEGLLEYNKEQSGSENQDSLFGLMEEGSSLPSLTLKDAPEAEKEDKLMWEKELLGLYISGHPLDKYKDMLGQREYTIQKINKKLGAGMLAVAAGIIEDIKTIFTKKGDKMAFVRLADLTGSIEVVVFPEAFKKYVDILEKENCIVVKGKLNDRNGDKSLLAEEMKKL